MKLGKFTAFEGLDGSGKSKQMAMAFEYFSRKDKNSHFYMTREPTGHIDIRKKFESTDDTMQSREWLLKAFIKDRKSHIPSIKTMLSSGAHVFCDRYQTSTYVYQTAQGIPFGTVRRLSEGMLKPDVILLYDVPAKVAYLRKKKEGATSSFEKNLGFQQRVRDAYLRMPLLLPRENFIVIDGNRKPDAVFKDTKKALEKILR